ncbi:MAG: hypothetical protein JNM34_12290 [Chthonomonadaceae bacterium]|nr:hypothetical protein [Chthonomonadaceae bacterium]
MDKDIREKIATAKQSADRFAFDKALNASIENGTTEERLREHYQKVFSRLKRGVSDLLELLDLHNEVSDGEAQAVAKVFALPALLKQVKQGKAKLSELTTLANAVDVLNVTLKQRRLDILIESFGKATDQLADLRQQADNQLKKAAKAVGGIELRAAKSVEAQAAQEGAVRRLNRIEGQANRRTRKIQGVEATAEGHLKVIRELETNASASERSVQAIQKQLDVLADHVNGHVQSMRDVQAEVKLTVDKYGAEKDAFLDSLESVKKQADVVLTRASATSLFGSYDTRRREISSKVEKLATGLYISYGSAIMAAVLVLCISSRNGWALQEQLLGKLGVVTPFVLVIWFFTVHYNRERLLEEEYAHRANLSISYPAFRGELQDLTTGSDDTLKQAAVLAAIDLTREIFSDPLSSLKPRRATKAPDSKKTVVEVEEQNSDLLSELSKKIGGLFQAATNLIEKASKIARPSD